MFRIYLDTCAWGRPFDEHSQMRIKEESEAFFQILHELDAGRVAIIGSVVLEDEVTRIKNGEKREAVSKLIEWSISEKVVDIPSLYAEIKKLGLKTRDSAHLACAIYGRAEYFITVDDAILRRKDEIKKFNITVLSPVEFIKFIREAE